MTIVIIALTAALVAQHYLHARALERLVARVASTPTVVLRDAPASPAPDAERHHISDLPYDDAHWNDTVGEEDAE
jgi:hypothetical protein